MPAGRIVLFLRSDVDVGPVNKNKRGIPLANDTVVVFFSISVSHSKENGGKSNVL